MAERIVQEESLTTVADAIREKTGGTDALAFPTGFVEAISGIQTGGGVSIKTGTVTLDAATSSEYRFVDDRPDIFILFSATETKPEYSSAKGIWVMVQVLATQKLWVFGYNSGTSKYYVPRYSVGDIQDVNMGRFTTGIFNGKLLAGPYKWIAIYGATM